MDDARLCCTGCSAVYRSAFTRCPGCGEPLAPLDDDPLVGTTFAGRYVVEELIGEGAMSRVYRVRHVNLSRRFALKVLFGELAADATMRIRFAKEAECASRLDHPNVVSVTDFGKTDQGLLYLVMDYVEGRDLGAIIAEEGPLPADRVIALARQMASGLQHAHDRGLVHRDFKPENVVVIHDESGAEIPRILDFGLAISATPEEDESRLTMTGTVVGTPIYIAPEQACGLEVDHRADLFSLGVCVYEMLAGRPPFDGQPMEVVRLNVTALPPRIATRSPGVIVAPELEEIVTGLMERDRDHRYASAEEVIEVLDELLAEDQRRPLYRAPSPSSPAVRAVRSSEEALAPTELPRPEPLREVHSWPPVRAHDRVRAPAILAGAALVLGLIGWSLPGEQDPAEASPGVVARGEAQVPAGLIEPDLPNVNALETVSGPESVNVNEPEPEPVNAPAPDPVNVNAPDPEPVNEPDPDPEPVNVNANVNEPEPEPEPETEPDPETASETATATAPEARTQAQPAPASKPRARATRTPSAEDLTRRYRRIGRALDRLASKSGEDAAAPLRERFFAIPYADALRRQTLRRQVERDLRAIEGRIARASR